VVSSEWRSIQNVDDALNIALDCSLLFTVQITSIKTTLNQQIVVIEDHTLFLELRCILDEFAKLRRASISFVRSMHLSLSLDPSTWNSVAHTGHIVVKFHTGLKSAKKTAVWLKSGKSNRHFYMKSFGYL